MNQTGAIARLGRAAVVGYQNVYKCLFGANKSRLMARGVRELRVSFVCGLSLCALVLALSGCGTTPTVATVPRTAQDRTPSCYVFGRFVQKDPSPWYLQNVFGNQMAVVLVLKEIPAGTNYQIRFQKSEPVVAVIVKPGTYAISEIAFSRGNTVLERRAVTNEFLRATIEIPPGHGCYLGDWLAHASSQTYGAGAAVGTTYVSGRHRDEQQWELKSVENNFTQTKKDLLCNYPKLQATTNFSAMK